MFITKRYSIGTILAGLLAMTGLTAPRTLAQATCPIRFENVSPSGNGVSSSSYVIVFRNATRFPLKGIVFQAAINDTPSTSNPTLFVSHHLVAPGADDSVVWNAGLLARPASAGTAFKVWPSMVVFRDNSAWKRTSLDDCSFRFSSQIGTDVNHANPGEPSELLTAAQKIALIDAGKASLCLVTTQPAGATVDVDGHRIGVSPIKFVLLKQDSGARTIEIYKDGYEVISRLLTPTGTTIHMKATLKPFSPQ